MSIEVSNLSFKYTNQMILNNISFKAEEGQLLSVLGPNGVGNSTLFRCILGLLEGYEGHILLNGNDSRELDIKKKAKQIAYIPQSHYPSFNFSVFDMVLMGTSVQVSYFSSPGKKQIELADSALERLGIGHLKKRGYNQISGGEQQLVLLARALVQRAKILIMDEPTSNLDFGNQIRVLSQIKSLTREGYTIIQSTHNPDQTFQFSDRVLAMKEGKVLAYGSPAKIFTNDLIQNLYGVEVNIQSLYSDKVRVSIPKSIIETENLCRRYSYS